MIAARHAMVNKANFLWPVWKIGAESSSRACCVRGGKASRRAVAAERASEWEIPCERGIFCVAACSRTHIRSRILRQYFCSVIAAHLSLYFATALRAFGLGRDGHRGPYSSSGSDATFSLSLNSFFAQHTRLQAKPTRILFTSTENFFVAPQPQRVLFLKRAFFSCKFPACCESRKD